MFNSLVMNNLIDNKNGDFHQNTVILTTNSPTIKEDSSNFQVAENIYATL
jgi:hypothetical protein